MNQFLRPLEPRPYSAENYSGAIMSSSDRGRGNAPGTRPEPASTAANPATADSADPYASWLDRMQRARARHAAITKNLYTWSNYKNWADRVRDSWEGKEAEGAAGNTAGGGHAPVSGHAPGPSRPPFKK